MNVTDLWAEAVLGSNRRASITNKFARATVSATFLLATLVALDMDGIRLDDLAARVTRMGMMPCQTDEVFEDQYLASLYDHFNTWGADDDFYLQLARETGGRVLDLGCGTGMLACRIAQEGLSVAGVDPAEGMLRVARSHQGTEPVSWIKAGGQTLRLPLRFDLIYMTGHAFQALLTDDEAIAVLRTAHDHLAKDGRFAFESRNPATRAWLSWTPDQRKVVTTREHGRVEEFHDTVANQNTGIVDITHHYRFLDTDKAIVGHSRLRFVDQNHLTIADCSEPSPDLLVRRLGPDTGAPGKPRVHRCDQPRRLRLEWMKLKSRPFTAPSVAAQRQVLRGMPQWSLL